MNTADKRFIEFIESMDMFVPDNDCSEYRDGEDYKAIEFMDKKLEEANAHIQYHHELRLKELAILNLANAKLSTLKRLMLLTHDAVSDVEMNELTTRQWMEFITEFPDEAR
jgi:hypothetical protein